MAKKKYEVVNLFTDLQDNNKRYEPGDRYPKPANRKVSHERILELTSSDNKQGKVLIKEIEE